MSGDTDEDLQLYKEHDLIIATSCQVGYMYVHVYVCMNGGLAESGDDGDDSASPTCPCRQSHYGNYVPTYSVCIRRLALYHHLKGPGTEEDQPASAELHSQEHYVTLRQCISKRYFFFWSTDT